MFSGYYKFHIFDTALRAHAMMQYKFRGRYADFEIPDRWCYLVVCGHRRGHVRTLMLEPVEWYRRQTGQLLWSWGYWLESSFSLVH